MKNKDITQNLLELLDSNTDDKTIAKNLKDNNISIDDLKVMYALGERFYNEFSFKEAEIIFGAYAILNPYDHRGIGGLSSIYLQTKDFKKALSALNILKTNPLNCIDETFLNISLCHYKLKEYTAAAAILLIIKTNEFNSFHMKRYEYLKSQLSKYI